MGRREVKRGKPYEGRVHLAVHKNSVPGKYPVTFAPALKAVCWGLTRGLGTGLTLLPAEVGVDL